MKIPCPYKFYYISALLLTMCSAVFGQNSFFKQDSQKDSIWIEQLIQTVNTSRPTEKDSGNVAYGEWIKGKVIYSNDASLKAEQLIGTTERGDAVYAFSIQYLDSGKVIERDLLSYTNLPDFRNYVLKKIYRLPDKTPAYVFLFLNNEYLPGHTVDTLDDFLTVEGHNLKRLKTITYAAEAFRMEKDSVEELTFPEYIERRSGYGLDTTAYESLELTSDIRQEKQFPKPFMHYDTAKHTLSFLNVFCADQAGYASKDSTCINDYLRVDRVTYLYQDTAFVIDNDTSYYYPSLESLDKTIARHSYKVGKYNIKATAISGYEPIYTAVYSNIILSYKIGTQNLQAYNNDELEFYNKNSLKPDCRLQKNGSLIFLLTERTNGYGPGACGSASYENYRFWLTDGKSSSEIFSYQTGSCDSRIRYTFHREGEEINGNFFLADTNDTDQVNLKKAYWVNNSTYVFTIDGDAGSRKFYIHFDPENKQKPVKLKVGALHRARN